MYRLSIIINEIYAKYLPVACKAGIVFNLDFPDITLRTDDEDRVKKDVEKTVKKALEKSIKGEITIAVRKGKIIISDTGTVLSKAACALFSGEHIAIKSRVGFGTEVTISF